MLGSTSPAASSAKAQARQPVDDTRSLLALAAGSFPIAAALVPLMGVIVRAVAYAFDPRLSLTLAITAPFPQLAAAGTAALAFWVTLMAYLFWEGRAMAGRRAKRRRLRDKFVKEEAPRVADLQKRWTDFKAAHDADALDASSRAELDEFERELDERQRVVDERKAEIDATYTLTSRLLRRMPPRVSRTILSLALVVMVAVLLFAYPVLLAPVVIGLPAITLWYGLRELPPTLRSTWPVLVVAMFFAAVFQGLLYTPAPTEYVHFTGDVAQAGWYVEVARGDGLTYLVRCDVPNQPVEVIPDSLIASAVLRPQSQDSTGMSPTALDLVTGRSKLALGPHLQCAPAPSP